MLHLPVKLIVFKVLVNSSPVAQIILALLFSNQAVALICDTAARCSNLCCLSSSQNQQGKTRQHYKWRGDETLVNCPFLFFFPKFSFCCMFYWQWSLPGMLDLHWKIKSRARELCCLSSDFCFVFSLLPIPVKSTLLAGVGHFWWHSQSHFFPVLMEAGIRRTLAYWC